MSFANRPNRPPAYLDQYLGLWHFEQARFMRAIDLARAVDLRQHVREQPGFIDRHLAAREQATGNRAARAAGSDAPGAGANDATRDGVRGATQEATRQAVRNGYSYDVIDGVAILTAEGTLMKHASSYDDSTSTAMLRNSIRKMRVDPLVRGAILVIDSPGGTVSGAYDLAEDVEQLAKAKPVYAYGENLLCSAAYLQAAMTRGISINRNAIVGSIGTYCVVYDYSKLFESEGVKAIVIGSGGVKGAGVIGTEVTDEQIAEWQKEIDQLNGLFIQFVARGRKLSKQRVTELADGRVYVGDEAVKIGLAQKVESLDQLFVRVRQEIGGPSTGAGGVVLQAANTRMTLEDVRVQQIDKLSDNAAATTDPPADPEQPDSPDPDTTPPADGPADETKPQAEGGDADVPTSQGAAADSNDGGDPVSQSKDSGTAPAQTKTEQAGNKAATVVELRAACPGATAEFLLDQQEKGATVAEAKDAFIQFQATQIKARDEELAKAEKQNAELQASGKTKVGVPPVSEAADKAKSSARGDGSAAAELEHAIDPLVKAGMPRHQAIAKVFAENDDLRQRYVAEQNERRRKE